MNTNCTIHRDEAKRLLNDPMFRAWAEGKHVQYSAGGAWWDVIDGSTFADVANMHRIKPEPTRRPWKPEEVPVGALIRTKNNINRTTMLAVYQDTITIALRETLSFLQLDEALQGWEHSLDNGKTWQPCGVLTD